MTIEEQIEVLEDTIEWYESQYKPSACGWMKTTIYGLQERIKVLRKKLPPKTDLWL